MKCPKCDYLGFDTGGRCKNCGYDFSLVEPPVAASARRTPASGPSGGVSLRDPHLARGARYRRPDRATPSSGLDRPLMGHSEGTPIDLPLFGDDDGPLPLPPSRRPLAVRRATPAPGRIRPGAETPRPEALPLQLDETPGEQIRVRPEPLADTGRRPATSATTRQMFVAATPGRRITAALVDLGLVALIDAGVLYFTLRLCDLPLRDLGVLPVVPLVAFFLVLNGGYLILFTGALGQTLGKMAVAIEVVSDRQGGMDMRRATLRAAALLLSVAPAGLGCLAALVGDRRALHDRLSGTRVIQVAA